MLLLLGFSKKKAIDRAQRAQMMTMTPPGAKTTFSSQQMIFLICFVLAWAYYTRWWFQICVIFTPTWGDDPI